MAEGDERPPLTKRIVRWVALSSGLLAIGVSAAGGTLLYPYLRDDLRIDGIVRVVALDWRDFGRARADERLRYEFAAQNIGRHTSPADCTLEPDGAERVVRCAWEVEIRLLGEPLPLGFVSEARIGPDGELR